MPVKQIISTPLLANSLARSRALMSIFSYATDVLCRYTCQYIKRRAVTEVLNGVDTFGFYHEMVSFTSRHLDDACRAMLPSVTPV